MKNLIKTLLFFPVLFLTFGSAFTIDTADGKDAPIIMTRIGCIKKTACVPYGEGGLLMLNGDILPLVFSKKVSDIETIRRLNKTMQVYGQWSEWWEIKLVCSNGSVCVRDGDSGVYVLFGTFTPHIVATIEDEKTIRKFYDLMLQKHQREKNNSSALKDT